MKTKTRPRTSAGSISDQLRAALTAPGRCPHAIAMSAGVAPSVVSRFVGGTRGITSETFDRLAAVLGLRMVDTGRGRAAGGSGAAQSKGKSNGADRPAALDLAADLGPAGA
jgi:hypothetical protein